MFVRWMTAIFCLTLFAGCSDASSKTNNDNNACSDTDTPECGTCAAAVCVDGAWDCQGTPCNQPTCEGEAPGCVPCATPVCVDEEWGCDDSQCVGTLCYPHLKPECPFGREPECISSDESDWVCTYECEFEAASNLAGVSIGFETKRCVWTVDEASQGISMLYTISIEDPLTVTPQSQRNGCDDAEGSGLLPAERISGGEQNYCLCDTGLCNYDPTEVQLMPGTYQGLVSWDGVNWSGPSDTGNPKGDPFPTGIYEVEVRLIGTDDQGADYEVVGKLPISLTP